MSEFVDNQAEESENSGERSSGGGGDHNDDLAPKAKRVKKMKKVKKKEKKKKKKQIASDDDEDEEDMEDYEGRIQKEMEGFVVDEGSDVEQSGNDDDEKSDAEKDDLELDEDDLEMLNENLDIQRRSTGGRVIIDSDEEEDDRERIKHDLFADFEYPGREQSDEGATSDKENAVAASEESGSESGASEDDFVVTDDGRQARKKHRHRHAGGVAEQSMKDAQEIFGVDDFNFAEFYDEDLEPGEDEEEYPEEEGDGEMLSSPKMKLKRKKGRLLDTIEPDELDEKLLLDTDKRIQFEDCPERFQLRSTPVTEASDNELELESKWILEHAFESRALSKQKDSGLEKIIDEKLPIDEKKKLTEEAPERIREALKLMRNQLFEVPFIAVYRRESVESCLAVADLWKVYQWDEKWCSLEQRKKRLVRLMERMYNYQMKSDSASEIRAITVEDIKEVEDAQTADGFMDVSCKFQLYYGSAVPRMVDWEKIENLAEDDPEREAAETRFKTATRSDKYTLCVENGLSEMAARFGLTPLEFAENLDWKRHEVKQDEEEPRAAAKKYVSKTIPTEDLVLAGAVHIVAKELSREPKVREVLRRLYRERLMISLWPTKKGRQEIDESHKLYFRRYLKEKPVKYLECDEYLWYIQAKSHGLLSVRLHCDSEDDIVNKRTLVDELLSRQPYHRDEYSSLVEKWNEVRAKVVRMCVTEFLLPVFEKEAHNILLQEARDFVAQQCAKSLSERIMIAPYPTLSRESGGEHGMGTTIMGIAYPEDRDQASFCVVIDDNGQVVDYIRLFHLIRGMNSKRPGESALKRQDLEYLRKFIEKRDPRAIAICGENMDAYYLKFDVSSVVVDCRLRHDVPVEIIDNEPAKVYMHSKIAMAEFPDFPPFLRQAVSLARLLLDPLVEYCHLCNTERDILCVTFHPLQSELNKEDLMSALSIELINRVNEVGVDVNRCLEFPYSSYMLQFVCGLGPRKAAHLLKILRQSGSLLLSRVNLVKICRFGPKIFMNAAGFIKIDTATISEKTDDYVEVLDGSRVHPEYYEWARRMAIDALEKGEAIDATGAIEEILQYPEKLRDLDLKSYAELLTKQGYGDKYFTLHDIRAELNERYKDLRWVYETPSTERLFTMLTKETPNFIGKRMMGRVMNVAYRKLDERVPGPESEDNDKIRRFKCSVCFRSKFQTPEEVWDHVQCSCPGQPVGVHLRLENGIKGFVPNKFLTDEPHSFESPLDCVKLDQPVRCVVLQLNMEKFSATCSCRSCDLTGDEEDKYDEYFDREKCKEDESRDDRKVKKKKEALAKKFLKRVICHPSFHNVTFEDAERMLQNFEQGEAVIRPSLKGSSFLAVTWKVAHGVYQHIAVREEGKRHEFSLGKRLFIDSDEFEDLDEILSRHVQPMAALAREVMAHKCFLEGVYAEDKETIKASLNNEKKANAARIPYQFTPSRKHPGYFLLSYLPRVTVRHEYLAVTAEGFLFRQQTFPTLETLLTYFKAHFNEPPPEMRNNMLM